MAEQQVGFLYEAARSLRGKCDSLDLLRSYYLMRCKTIGNKGQDLPAKQFGPRVMCSRCSTEWSAGGYHTKVVPLRMLKKSTRRRIRHKEKANKKDALKTINEKIYSNSLERICNFCGHTTAIKMLKPASNRKPLKLATQQKIITPKKPIESTSVTKKQKIPDHKEKKSSVQKQEINIYSTSKSVFTMNSKNKQPVEEKTQKKKTSRKKDKFAGLCKEAVLASARAKQNPGTRDSKLSLFLKPSL